ncbi:MAG: carboxypeptidase-like regulatory domain-containing protein, partial [Terriglobia bacterium]
MRERLIGIIWAILVALSSCTLFVGVAFSQIDRGNLNGIVTDPSGASIPNAKVEVVAPDTGFKRETTTGSSGVYSIGSLPNGTYDLTVSAKDFQTSATTGIQLSVGQTRTVNVQLVVGAPTTKVEVRSTVAALDSNDAQISTVIRTGQVENIPLNGRDWSLLMTLAPGAVNLGAGGQRDLRFVGRGIDDSNYTFDGVDATGVQEQSQKVGVRLAISLESIAEFRVSSSVYTADQGGSAGAIVSIVSKTGTNAFHGGVFEYLRNNVLDSRSPFDFPSIPPFRLNQFGGSIGGPIQKDRTFFFTDYEGLRQRLDTTIIGFVPNAAFRASVTNPALQPFLVQWPVGTVPVDSLTNEWISPQSNNNREDGGMFRLDHIFTDRTSIFARLDIDDANTTDPLDTLGGLDNPLIRPSNYVVQLTHTFSPTVINELRGGINRSALHHYQNGTCPLSAAANGLPGTACASVPPFDSPSDSQLDTEVGTTIDGYDDLTIVRGRHTIKLGIGVERHRLNNSDESVANGDLTYDSSADFLNNIIDNYSYVGPLTLGGERRTYIMPYA